VGEPVPIRHLGIKGEKTLKNLKSNSMKPNVSKALLTHWILSTETKYNIIENFKKKILSAAQFFRRKK
jgi:hypothetical protein